MTDEKMKILKMLEEHKISLDQASKLLNEIDNKNNNTTKKINNTISTLNNKIDDMVKEITPYAEKYTKLAVNKTSEVSNKVKDSYQKKATNSYNFHRCISIESLVFGKKNTILLKDISGYINIKGYNGDKISLDIKIKSSFSDAEVVLQNNDNIYYLDYLYSDVEILSIEGYIPEKLFSNIDITIFNNKIEISNIFCENLILNSKKCYIKLFNSIVNNLTVKNTNKEIIIDKLISKRSYIENIDGECKLNNLDVSELKVSNSNSAIYIENLIFKKENMYYINLFTNNAPIQLNTTNLLYCGYLIDATSILGKINLEIKNMSYLLNESSKCISKTIDFENKDKKINITLETTNANINIK